MHLHLLTLLFEYLTCAHCKMRSKNKLKQVFIFFLLPLCAGAQTLSGKVLTVKGQPVYLANVYLKKNTLKGTTTDTEGSFRLLLEGSEWTDSLMISMVGYKVEIIALSGMAREGVKEFRLQEEVGELDEVNITTGASLADEFSTKKLDRIAIYLTPGSSADPLKAITMLPAGTNTSETAEPELRGSAGDLSRVILNGVPLYKPVRSSQLNGMGFFSILNTELIEFQNVYASNPPLNYSNALAGLVEIGTRTELEENQAKLTFSLAGTSVLYGTPFKKKTTFLQAFSNYQYSDGYLSLNQKNTPRIKQFYNKDAGANFHHVFSKKMIFNTYSYFIDEGYKAESVLYNYVGEMNAHSRRYFNVLNLEYKNPKISGVFNNGVSIKSDTYGFGNITTRSQENQVYAAVEMKHFPTPAISYQAGVTYDYFNTLSTGLVPRLYFAVFPADVIYSRTARLENHNVEAYAYGRYASERIVLGVGLRKNVPVSEQDNYLSWQASLRYALAHHHSLLLSGGTYNGYGTATWFVQKFAPITVHQYAMEYNYRSNNTLLSAATYRKRQRSVYYFAELGSTAETRLDINGVEISGQQAWHHFTFTASYTWLDTQINNGSGWTRYTNNMKYFWKLSAAFQHLKWFNIAVSFITRPGHYYTPIIEARQASSVGGYQPIFGSYNAAQFKGYETVDINLSKLILINGKTIIPFFAITNVFNSHNQNTPIYQKDFGGISDYWYYQFRLFYFGVQISI